MYAITAFVLCTVVGLTVAYPTGAPIETCKTFNANHNGTLPQETPSNYEILINPTTVASGQSITVTIKGAGKEDTFRGFFIQGQDSDANERKPIGKFMHGADAQTLDCSGPGSKDSATHVDRDDKPSVTLQWVAPATFKGKIVFRAVIVKTFHIFWNNLVSAPLTVV